MSSTATEEFDTLSFEKQLTSLKDTQDSIQGLSSWCLQKRQHHKKIVASWLSILKRAKVEQRLTLFYLANDVIQYSKKKSYEFVESWGTTLQKATPLVRDDKIKNKILRIFRIWKERQIYDEEFLTDLTGLLSITAGKPADVDPNDFQAKQLVNKIRQCSVLETETEVQLKQINECTLPLKNVKVLCQLLKDRRDTDGAKKDLDDGILKLEGCVCAMQKELVARAALCRMLEKARIHYNTTKGEVKVVANAYKNFGNHVRGLKRKLDELCKELPSEIKSPVPSPPSPGEPVPSPGPDEDLELPSGILDNSNCSNLNNSFGSDMGKDFAAKSFSSFVGNSSFSLSSLRSASDILSGKSEEANKIEVINSRTDSATDVVVDIHSLLQSLIPNKPPLSLSSNDSYLPLLTPPPPPPPPILPGLDLIDPSSDTVETPRPVLPPMNFYGSISNTSIKNTDVTPSPDLYVQDTNTSGKWNSAWDMQRILPLETPESPLERFSSPPLPPPIIPVPPPMPDVDHRQLLAPPLLIHQVLMKGDDVDHRRLPPPPILSPQLQNDLNRSAKDVDHRNLISLTMGSIPPPPAPPPISPWTPLASQSDQDYRSDEFSTAVPPPLPIMTIQPPTRRLMTDNVESIDMEMSDEENMDDPNQSSQDDEFTRNLRLENSMARIHGHSPGSYQQQPPTYRKQDANNRTPNNRMSTQNDSHNNSQQNSSFARTNLVRINSNDDLDNSSNYNYFNKDKDIFSDFPSNAMNPQNPNLQDNNSSFYSQNDEDWENNEEEESWQKRGGRMMNPPMPNFARNNSMPNFSHMPPPINFSRKPTPLLTTPLIDEHNFKTHLSRGNGNYRRPRGHHRPPRGNRMSNHW